MKLNIISTVSASALAAVLVFACAPAQQDEAAISQDAAADVPSRTIANTQAAGSASLDGRTFIIEMAERDGSEVIRDTVSFSNGMFRSVACLEYGFGAGSYTTGTAHDAMSFSVTTISDTEGRIEWKGTVAGDAVRGTLDWVKDGESTEYWFRSVR